MSRKNCNGRNRGVSNNIDRVSLHNQMDYITANNLVINTAMTTKGMPYKLTSEGVLDGGWDGVDEIRPMKVIDLKTDTYQRCINNTHVNDIVVGFMPWNVGVILVSMRDGELHVIDGQHRVEAYKRLGIPNIMCKVLRGLTKQQEAHIFALQTAMVLALKPYDKQNAFVHAETDLTALQIHAVLSCRNLITDGGRSPVYKIMGTLRAITERDGPKVLDDALYIMIESWGYTRDVMRRSILAATAMIVDSNPSIDPDKIIKRMKQVSLTEIIKGERSEKTTMSPNGIYGVANKMAMSYNRGLQAAYRIKLPDPTTRKTDLYPNVVTP